METGGLRFVIESADTLVLIEYTKAHLDPGLTKVVLQKYVLPGAFY
jgi:hypothetical protein